jgi:hypothetical protein
MVTKVVAGKGRLENVPEFALRKKLISFPTVRNA